MDKFKIAKQNKIDRNIKATLEQVKQQTYVNNLENKEKINEIIDNLEGTTTDLSTLTDTVSTNTNDISGLQGRMSTAEGKISTLEGINEYSTSEQAIGKWINDETLYRKVIDVGTLPNATSETTSTGLSDVKVLRMYGYCVASNNTTLPLPYTATSNGYSISLSFNTSNEIVVDAGTTDRSGYNGTVIIEYIKD